MTAEENQMFTTVRKINQYFRKATRADVNTLLSAIILSDRQLKVFDMFYIKKYNIGYIADTLCVSQTVICEELKTIRNKISVIIP